MADKDYSRRKFIKSAVTGATSVFAILAGCSSEQEGENEGNPGGEFSQVHEDLECYEGDTGPGEEEVYTIGEEEYSIENVAVNEKGATLRINGDLEKYDEGDKIKLEGGNEIIVDQVLNIYAIDDGQGIVTFQHGEDC